MSGVHLRGMTRRSLARAVKNLDRDRADRPIGDPAAQGGNTIETAVRALRTMAEKRVKQPPERIPGQPDRDENQQHLAERLMSDRLQRTALVRRLSAGTDCEFDRQDPDDPVDDTARDEAGPGKRFERRGTLDAVCRCLRTTDGPCCCRIPNAHTLGQRGRTSFGYVPCRERGTQSVTAAGSTFTLNDFVFVRSPPSSSYITLRFSLTFTDSALAAWTNGDASAFAATVRAAVRAHCVKPSAVITPTSSFPSSGRASANTSIPPKSRPRLPMRMQVALPLNQLTPSTLTSAPKGSERRFFSPDQTYATRPRRSFRPPSASRIMAASIPDPAITANRSPLSRPTSILRRSPRRPTSTASSMSSGSSKFVASRFYVPAGSTASGTAEPASTSMHRWTSPSPPHAKTSSAPSASRRLSAAGALLLFGTSRHSGSATPARSSARRNSRRPPPSDFAAFATTPTFTRGPRRVGSRRHPMRGRRGRASRRPQRRPPFHPRRRSGDAYRGRAASMHRRRRSARQQTRLRHERRGSRPSRSAGARARSRRRSKPPCGPTDSWR